VRRALAAAALALSATLAHGDTRADDAGSVLSGLRPSGAASRVVALVGVEPAAQSIPLGDLQDRLAAMPAFQQATFGKTPDAIRRGVLEQVLVRDALLALGARAEKLDANPAVARALDHAAADATLRALRAASPPPASIPMADVQAYYDRNRARFEAPARFQAWRILCATQEEAAAVLAEAQADPTPKKFAELARDHSQDKATALRGGDLGFLTAEGESSEPGLRVEPAVVKAALALKDGELAHAPVAEGTYFAVLWRRGSIAALKRTVDEAAASIRQALWRDRLKEAADARLAELRAARVRDLNEEPLDRVELPEAPHASRDASQD
jgi:peptidyl-prolyl cis-trans isomerase C